MDSYINIRSLNLDELVGVVSLYPWYGAARVELSRRMARLGGDSWGKSQYADAALYVASRRRIADLLRDRSADYSDKDLEKLLGSYIKEEEKPSDKRKVRVVGGDYFSQEEYDNVRQKGDNVFSKFATRSQGEGKEGSAEALSDEFCTETLAKIYEEQGYYDQARHIYSRLLLKFPEKNAYFAGLIQKLDENAYI